MPSILYGESLWWDVPWNGGVRGRIEQLPRAQLAEVRQLCGERGLWREIGTRFAAGTNPSAPMRARIFRR